MWAKSACSSSVEAAPATPYDETSVYRLEWPKQESGYLAGASYGESHGRPSAAGRIDRQKCQAARLGADAARFQGRIQLRRVERWLVPGQYPNCRAGGVAELRVGGETAGDGMQRHDRRRSEGVARKGSANRGACRQRYGPWLG